MALEIMTVRKNGSMVSQCAVSCVRKCVHMLGTWNKKGEAQKLGQRKKAPASEMVITGIFGRPFVVSLKGQRASLSCWAGTGTKTKYPLRSPWSAPYIVRRYGGDDPPNIYVQNLSINYKVDTKLQKPTLGS